MDEARLPFATKKLYIIYVGITLCQRVTEKAKGKKTNVIAPKERTCRAFAAFDLPGEALAFIEGALANLGGGKKAPGKWVAPGNRHVTIHFLGETPIARSLELDAKLRELIARRGAPVFEVKGLGTFGRPPRTLFLDLLDPGGAAARLVAEFERENGLTPDKPWIPHLTLARFRAPAEGKAWQRLGLQIPAGFRFQATGAAVYTSELTPSGPIYRAVRDTPDV